MSSSVGASPHVLAGEYATLLARHYEPGFGIMPASHPSENFYRQVWARDFAHAGANYFLQANPQAIEDSLATFLRHQRGDGAFPLRVEKEYMLLKVIPGLRAFARPAFSFFEKVLRGRTERPVFSGQDFSSAEDTIPALLIIAGKYYESSERGRAFVVQHLDGFLRACTCFLARADADGLISMKRGNVDWADSILRGGKLGTINVLWVYALKKMGAVLSAEGSPHAPHILDVSARAHAALMYKLYNSTDAYFRTAEGDDRVDTVATIFGALFFLEPEECVRVEETLSRRVQRASGLANFDPPYPRSSIMLPHKIIGHQGYHNEYVWPWVTCQNIEVKLKIAASHPDGSIRKQYKREAAKDLVDTAELFQTAGGAHEVFLPASRAPAITRWYKPPKNFLANLVTFMGAYRQLSNLDAVS
jgi:hypothetical protein